MKTPDIKLIQKRSIAWVKNNPDEALLCMLFGGFIAIACVMVAFYFATKANPQTAPEPIRAPKNWKFVERIEAGGGQVCDLYKRGEITQARCYGRDSSGNWVLKGTF